MWLIAVNDLSISYVAVSFSIYVICLMSLYPCHDRYPQFYTLYSLTTRHSPLGSMQLAIKKPINLSPRLWPNNLHQPLLLRPTNLPHTLPLNHQIPNILGRHPRHTPQQLLRRLIVNPRARLFGRIEAHAHGRERIRFLVVLFEFFKDFGGVVGG
jgi:hypothetical protein